MPAFAGQFVELRGRFLKQLLWPVFAMPELNFFIESASGISEEVTVSEAVLKSLVSDRGLFRNADGKVDFIQMVAT